MLNKLPLEIKTIHVYLSMLHSCISLFLVFLADSNRVNFIKTVMILSYIGRETWDNGSSLIMNIIT